MNLKKKMIVAFSVITLICCLIFGEIYYQTAKNRYIESEYSIIQNAAENYAQQFDNTLMQMEEIIDNILMDYDFLSAVKLLSHGEQEDIMKNSRYITAVREIENTIRTDYIKQNTDRVVLFMQNGIVISGGGEEEFSGYSKTDIQNLDWLDQLEGKRGECVLLGSHEDDWEQEEDTQVISLVKQILGKNLGYIEIQKTSSNLDEIFIPANGEWNLYIYQGESMIYSSAEENMDLFLAHSEEASENTGRVYARESARTEGIQVMIVDDTDILKEAIIMVLPLTILLTALVSGLCLICIQVISRRMTAPLYKLISIMEKTELSSLGENMETAIEDEDMKKLYKSYARVMKRLDVSIKKERTLFQMNKQAQYDLLQAQVNPHFLYNVLNVISARGASVDDDVICDICADLAQMLRYSTDIKHKYACLKEEIHYLECYLKLLKYRYVDKLSYEFDIEDEVKRVQLPKLVLQQLVENSITHGFSSIDCERQIRVSGKKEGSCIIFTVSDNGTGITEEKKESLYKEFQRMKELLSSGKGKVEMEIGGMGLANTYGRLYEIYGNRFSMEISRRKDGLDVSLIIDTDEGGHRSPEEDLCRGVQDEK